MLSSVDFRLVTHLAGQCQLDYVYCMTVVDGTDRLSRKRKKIDWTLKIGLMDCLKNVRKLIGL